MKKYLLVRWKKRWPIVPAFGFVAVTAALMNKGTLLGNPRFMGIFAFSAILFPFHVGGEILRED